MAGVVLLLFFGGDSTRLALANTSQWYSLVTVLDNDGTSRVITAPEKEQQGSVPYKELHSFRLLSLDPIDEVSATQQSRTVQ